ncbi:MAG TPA: hypothetical protein VN231_04055 [Allosphingosinicella sp.]|nr:hypothetical protein [Allosphingosinicella sp.]
MNEARPFASLSSGLLARKGAAKPAMRPQAYTSFEDLGWNDMGDSPSADEAAVAEIPEHVPSSIAALTPAPRPGREEPSVVAQQRAILESFEGEEESEDMPEAAVAAAEPEPAPRAEIVTLPKRVPIAAGRKAAFTLRLDPERHLRLRLACAVTGRSAQQIVTGALDELLAGIPEIEALASRVPSKAGTAGAKRS